MIARYQCQKFLVLPLNFGQSDFVSEDFSLMTVVSSSDFENLDWYSKRALAAMSIEELNV
jgi:hypothetical protein